MRGVIDGGIPKRFEPEGDSSWLSCTLRGVGCREIDIEGRRLRVQRQQRGICGDRLWWY